MAARGVYERLGMRRVINADATLTRLGGTLLPSPVLDALREAAGSFVDRLVDDGSDAFARHLPSHDAPREARTEAVCCQ
jgi:hypothetical protein